MASPEFAGIAALMRKAEDLHNAYEHGRAAAKYAEAAAAMQLLPSAGDDNLAVVLLQAKRVFDLIPDGYAALNPDTRAAARAAVFELLPEQMASCARRRAERTLLPGKCRALELQWAREVACAVTTFFLTVVKKEVPAVFTEADMEKLHDMQAFLASAVDLMRTIGLPEGSVLNPEACFLVNMESILDDDMLRFTSEHESGQQMKRAWRQLIRSKVLKHRGSALQEQIEYLKSRGPTIIVNPQAVLRQCGLSSCCAPEHVKNQFKLCAGCASVVYCCKEHQVAAWPAHKLECKAARAAGSGKRAGSRSAV